MTNYVAIDIGGTNIKYGLIDQDGQLVESHEVATEAHKGGPHILQKTKNIGNATIFTCFFTVFFV